MSFEVFDQLVRSNQYVGSRISVMDDHNNIITSHQRRPGAQAKGR